MHGNQMQAGPTASDHVTTTAPRFDHEPETAACDLSNAPVRAMPGSVLSRSLFLAVLLLPSALLAQSWTREKVEALPAAQGLSFERQEWRDAAGETATLHVVAFDARRATFAVADQGAEGTNSLAATVAAKGALAGCNGGFFHPDHRPLGLVTSGGNAVSTEARSSPLQSGVILVFANGSVRLQRVSESRPRLVVRDALQAGPFLVDRGSAVADLNAARRARRTLVASDGKGGWALVVTSRLTLAETGRLLASADVLPRGAGVQRALNFDGGSSTALCVKQPSGYANPESEFGAVRNFLLVLPRP